MDCWNFMYGSPSEPAPLASSVFRQRFAGVSLAILTLFGLILSRLLIGSIEKPKRRKLQGP